MINIKIKTLTSIHIGSGETLQYGNDFVRGTSKNGEYFIGIVDPAKVMKLIGEENIGNWVFAIEKKESTANIVKKYAPKATFEDYSKRIIIECSIAKSTDTLKEYIHDGMGRPYIPGSSIKGAIRTAVLSSIIGNEINVDETKLYTLNKDGSIKKDKKGNPIVKADEYEKKYLGKDSRNINYDIFRILHVSDALLGQNYELAVRMVNINERKTQSFWDISKQQLIEVIGPDDTSEFQMKMDLDSYKLAKGNNAIHTLPECMKDNEALFETINKYTLSQIKKEIDYWKERAVEDPEGSVDSYIEEMEIIKSEAEKCIPGKSCILRLGHGSGWRFITGAWTEDFNDFDSVIVPASRPNNQKYTEYDFPKSRRVSSSCELLGFVKLSVS